MTDQIASDRLVTVARRDDGVALVRLDRPKMNALSSELLAQLAEVVEGLAAEPPGAVVVWGGPRIFAAGADVGEFVDPTTGRPTPELAAHVARRFRRALDGLAALPVPTVAAIDGYALGGGCELALACDLRVVSAAAKLGQPEILLGIIPGGGGTQRLARVVGPARAKDIILTGRQVGAEEALRIGLADRVVPARPAETTGGSGGGSGAGTGSGGDGSGDTSATLDEALGLAAGLAAGPRRAMALAKAAIDAGTDLDLAGGLDREGALFAESFGTQDAAVGVASFLEHGPGRARFASS